MSSLELAGGPGVRSDNFRRLAVLFPAIALLAGCGSLPKRPPEKPSAALQENTDATFLGRAFKPVVDQHPGLSGVYPLDRGVDAFAARMVLARTAERSLDAQYYIWHPDDTGKLLANELIRAADRGVHVRLLLDDFGSIPSDENLLALNSHTNIEVRLFNPLVNRSFGRLGQIFEFGRFNRRMHNKSFTVDNQVTLVGGRNIGDEYFGGGDSVEFADFDVIAVGPVVKEAASSFDLYWRSPSSIPITSLTRKTASEEWAREQWADLAARCEKLRNSSYVRAVRDSSLLTELRERELDFFWGRAWLAYDLPDKVTSSLEDRSRFLTSQLAPVVAATDCEVLIVSAYFVPGPSGLKFFEDLRKRGIRVVIVTNSLAATDVAAVHSGYRRYRKALLRAGVELYEFKPTASLKEPSPKNKSAGGSSPGASRASLHAKTFVFDRRTTFVGSLNLDPRSTTLNTENGAVLEIPELAARTAEEIERTALSNCYRLEFVPGPGPCRECGQVNWVTEENGKVVRYTREPEAGFGRRFLVGLLSFLPLESQL
jgi:putative cardiolipin synthase